MNYHSLQHAIEGTANQNLSIFDGTTDNLPIMYRANVALTVLATRKRVPCFYRV